MKNVSIIGGTGYTGKELLKILLNHPEIKITHVTSENSAGLDICDVHKDLRNRIDLKFEKYDWKNLESDTDIAFLALPHGTSFNYVPEILKSGKIVIDFSADFRITDIDTYESWYKVKHTATDLLKQAVYGLPELFRDKIKEAKLIANPGCYATSVILGLAPLLKNSLIESKSIVVNAASGVSGAGKKLDMMFHYNEANENFTPYSVINHRHMPEIEQILKDVSDNDVAISFVPHLAPMNRGILSNIYVTPTKEINIESLYKIFSEFYQDEKFIRLLPPGAFPCTKDVYATNFCDIGLTIDIRTNKIIVMSAIDNLMKGASSQAVQNMNLICGFSEDTGLL